jgi:hypothetical protein
LLYYCAGLSPSISIAVYMYIELHYCFTTARVLLSVHTLRCVCTYNFTTALLLRGFRSLPVHSGVYVYRALPLLCYCAGLSLCIYIAVYMHTGPYYCFTTALASLSVYTYWCTRYYCVGRALRVHIAVYMYIVHSCFSIVWVSFPVYT